MNKVSIFIFSIFCVVIFLSCEKEESETEDCAGILGGERICGCTDPEALNYDSTATVSYTHLTLPTTSFL